MAAYEYLAIDASGRKCKGVLEGDSPRQIRQQLRERGLSPLSVTSVRQRHTRPQGFNLIPKAGLSSADLALLTRQLATLVHAGLPLEEALGAVASQSEKRRVRSLILGVRARVIEGYGLSVALSEYPGAFPDLFRATVAAGEKSGHLSAVLEQLADYTESQQASRQRIQLALLYPGILLVASIAIVSFLLGFVVPDVVRVFVDSGQQLPMLTRGLIGVSSLVRDWGLVGLGLLVVLMTAARLAMRSPHMRLRWHTSLLRIPVLGKLLRATDCARFASTLAILGRSGVPLVDALEIAGQVLVNRSIRGRMADVARSVREGGSLTRALERSGDLPPMMLHMIASGERSGELDHMLGRAAQQQEQDLAARIAMVVGLFEPAMLIFMGGAVLVIVLAILMPILNLNQLVG